MAEKREHAIYFKDKSRTKQAAKNECDINEIMRRARVAGGLPRPEMEPKYADVSNIPSYQEALQVVEMANEAFSSLPSKIRKRFANNPSLMVEFLQDPSNEEEARALGMLEPKAPETPLESQPRAFAEAPEAPTAS